MFLYHALWTLVVLFCAPLLPFPRAARFRSRLVPRLEGRRPRPGCLWVHALSVGEVLSAVPLVRALTQAYPEKAVALTVTTKQGWSVARRELAKEADVMLPMPLDFWVACRRLVRFLDPAAFILVETDLWPGLMHELERRGVPRVVVNGRISPRTARRYGKMGRLSRFLLAGPNRWFMQSDLDAERLVRAGVPSRRVQVTGNIKFDVAWHPMTARERAGLCRDLGLDEGDPVWVAGSTHEGEEDLVLDVFERLLKSFPTLRLILAPRRVERGGELCAAAQARGLRAAPRSKLGFQRQKVRVVVLDTLGELGRLYGLGTVAFVGGSFVPVGGHNLLEPARFGLPVLFGPHMHNFMAMSASLLEAGGAEQVEDAVALERVMDRLLGYPGEAARMGRCAQDFVHANSGALNRVLQGIGELVRHAR